MVLTLGLSPWIASILIALFLVICVLMILIVLIQRPQGGGLSGAFGSGSGGSGQTAFGTKTGDALTFATIGIFVTYLLLAVGLQFAARPDAPARGPAVIESSDRFPEDFAPPAGQVPAPVEDTPVPPVVPSAIDDESGEPSPGSEGSQDSSQADDGL